MPDCTPDCSDVCKPTPGLGCVGDVVSGCSPSCVPSPKDCTGIGSSGTAREEARQERARRRREKAGAQESFVDTSCDAVDD